MKRKNLKDLSNKELLTKYRMLKGMTAVFTGALIALFFAVLYLTVRDGINLFIVVPFGFIPLLILNYTILKKLKTELNIRGLNTANRTNQLEPNMRR